MSKTILTLLLSSATTSAWWATGVFPEFFQNPALAFLTIVLTAGTLVVIVVETLKLID